MPAFQASPGTRDILPPESDRWRRFVTVFADLAERSGYGLVIPPMFEDRAVFSRIGEATDIVSKEMFDFEDNGGRQLALRPEQTASVVRAFVEHRPTMPWKVWYAGPNFRQERPQKGRYRQFDQVGVEVLGIDDPLLDVEVVALASRFYTALGLRRVTLLLNSMGDAGDRGRYAEALATYFGARTSELSEQSRATLERNPMRVLDSKRPEDAAVVAEAPSMTDYLSAESAAHFAEVQRGLDELDVPFVLAPRLVRGIDYYRRTTFEFAAESLEAAQNGVGGGGRYDGLSEDLGGPATPGVGFALGLDRTLLACDSEGVFEPPRSDVDVFVIDTTGGHEALVLTDELRRAGLGADRAFENRSMKSQMKQADRSGAAVAAIIGSDEKAAGTVTIRPLRDGGEQVAVSRDVVVEHVRKMRTHE
jgi:histidyl-tRNA synthetase